ncbi:MAG: cell division protease FtsH, partial [Thermoanaerobaculia bacterium]|nr:cell division protease FtsH [Thermoanaerobaculia bacterium]
MDPETPPPRNQRGPGRVSPSSLPKWSLWVLLGVAAAALLIPTLFSSDSGKSIPYSEVIAKSTSDQVKSIDWNNTDGAISGELKDGTKFTSNGPLSPSDDDRKLFNDHGVQVDFKTPQGSIWPTLIIYVLPIALVIGFFVVMQRRAQSQMGGIMSIG